MSWPETIEANNFRQTYIQGFLDLSGGDIINRTSGLRVESDISSNANIYANHHVSIGTQPYSFTANSLLLSGETIRFTVPLFLNELKYFCMNHSGMVGSFNIGDSTEDSDKTYYIRGADNAFSSPYYIFSETSGGTSLNSSSNLTLHRGSTYTFIRTDSNSVHPFNIGSNWKANDTGMYITSTGTGSSVFGTTTHQYPLTINGVANIKKNLYVEQDVSLNGMINMGSVVYQF
jgi:hypothetical protein